MPNQHTGPLDTPPAYVITTFELRYLHGFDNHDIGRIIGKPFYAVHGILKRWGPRFEQYIDKKDRA